MNKIYRVVWSDSHMSWVVVSEFGKGKAKSSSKKNKQKYPFKLNFSVAALTLLSAYAHGLDINSNTIIDSSTSINDGLQWTSSATLEVNNGADVIISGGDPSINMLPSAAPSSNVSLWLNGGNLSSSGNMMLGNSTFIQIGGNVLGGNTGPSQLGGSSGQLNVGDFTTPIGASKFTLWMFGSSDNTAKLSASNISLTANNNDLFLARAGTSELGVDIDVTGNFYMAGASSSSLVLTANSQLTVGGDLYLDTTNGSFLVTQNEGSNGINVGGDMTLVNNIKTDDINSVATDAGIFSTIVNVDGNINLIGKNVGNSSLQLLNAAGTGVTTNGSFNISSEISGNTTDVAFGHSSKVTAGENINLSSVLGGNVNLYIGNSLYGGPTSIIAKEILMSGQGNNSIIFNNNKALTPGDNGYVFTLPINGLGSVEQQSGHTTLTSASDYNGGTLISGGLLSIANSNALGTGGVVINTDQDNSTAGLDIAYTDGSSFTNALTGNGNTTVSGIAQISGENTSYVGNWNITGHALTGDMVSTTQSNFGSGVINIEENGSVIAETQDQFIFDNVLTGTGTLIANNNNSDFSFSSAVGSGFIGNVILKNNTFTLDDTNTKALTGAALYIGEGNITTVGTGTQNIGGLAFDGGTLVFGSISPGNTSSNEFIEVAKDLNLTGSGKVQISTGNEFENAPQQPDAKLTLMQQDDVGVMVKLAESEGSVTGSGGNLELIDQNGNIISEQIISSITQNGEVVANGYYDYRLTSSDANDGLYINYGLKEVELLATGENALTLNAEGYTGNSADLSAKVTGTGDIAFDSLKGNTVTLSNLDNDYTGITDIRSGNLAMMNDNVLGNTSELKLAAETGFDMRGYSQAISKLSAESGSLITLDGGHLTLLDGGYSAGSLTGEGSLNVAGGTLDISGANIELNAATTIAKEAIVTIDDTLGLGIGNIVATGLLEINNAKGTLFNSISDNGEVALQSSDVILAGNNQFAGIFDIDEKSSLAASSAQQLGAADILDAGKLILSTDENWSLNNNISGSGDVVKYGNGNVTLGTGSQWTGFTDINSGGLILGDSENEVTLISKQVNIHTNGHLSGYGGVDGNVDNDGTLYIGYSPGEEMKIKKISRPSTFTIGGNLTNSGHIWTGLGSDSAGNQLVINGNYHGNSGYIHLNTALNDDNSVTDKIIVNGDTSGATNVNVTNLGGSGAQTLDGIEIIHVAGNSDGEFIQDGRIVAGVYDYSLVRGQDSKNSNWYLTSHSTVPPEPGIDPTEPGDIRPEAGSYIANLVAANTLFLTTLHDRVGESHYIDTLTGERKTTSMWLRQVGGHNRWKDNSGQLSTKSNSYVIQLGGDVARWSTNNSGSWHVGIMAGYGNNSSNTRSSYTGYTSKGSVNGYSAGLYATWYENEETKLGSYLDAWSQYGRFNNNVKGQELQGESYKSSGFTNSLELGYTKKIGTLSGSKGSENELYIQPKAQAIWMGIKADNHKELNGTQVSGIGENNIQTRLGLRTYIKGRNAIDNKNEREFQPFVEATWIHNSNDFGAKMDGFSTRQKGASNLGEVKTGLEAKINNKLNIWGNVVVQVGDKGYSDSSATIGIKYQF